MVVAEGFPTNLVPTHCVPCAPPPSPPQTVTTAAAAPVQEQVVGGQAAVCNQEFYTKVRGGQHAQRGRSPGRVQQPF